MRALVIVLVLAACGGGSASHRPGGGVAATATVFAAARYVPGAPTFVVSAKTFRDGQAAFRAVFELLGIPAGFELSEVTRELQTIFGVDVLDAAAVEGIGVDLAGSTVVFSEDINPTFVIHLRSPEQIAGFLDGQKSRGFKMQSVIEDGVEVFRAKIAGELQVSWAVDHEWLWVHFTFDKADGFDWFTHSRHPTSTAWTDSWSWASGLAANAPVSGWLDLEKVVSIIGDRTHDSEPIACAKQLLAVRRVAVNIEADLQHAAATFAFDLGAASDGLRASMLAPPPGWATASANAPLAMQWNIDAFAAAKWFAPCVGDDDLEHELDRYGVRSLRAFVRELHPDDKEGVGAVSVDLTTGAFLRSQLDQVPGRSAFESSRTFGQYKGKHLKVPMVTSFDYVLTDALAIIAMGDKVLETIGSGTPAQPAPAFEVAVRPQGMPAETWRFLLSFIDDSGAKRAAERLMLWRELLLSGRLEGTSLVVTGRATRR